MPAIRIDRVEVHLRGVSPGLVRASSEGLGNEVLEQLIRERLFLNEKTGSKINRIDPDPLKISMDESPSDLRRMIAGRIVESISIQYGQKISNSSQGKTAKGMRSQGAADTRRRVRRRTSCTSSTRQRSR